MASGAKPYTGGQRGGGVWREEMCVVYGWNNRRWNKETRYASSVIAVHLRRQEVHHIGSRCKVCS